MTYSGEDYDVIVIGKGHAGKEAAKKAARMGKTALLLKLNPGSIASVMCSSSQQGSPGGFLPELKPNSSVWKMRVIGHQD